MDCRNYSDTTISSIPSKMLARILEVRLRKYSTYSGNKVILEGNGRNGMLNMRLTMFVNYTNNLLDTNILTTLDKIK